MKKISFAYASIFVLISSCLFTSCGDKGGNVTPEEEPKPVQPRAYTTVSTFAGSTTAQTGSTNGTGTDARFNSTRSAIHDSNGNLFVADAINHVIRKITPAGVVTTFAGTVGVTGGTNGTGTNATFNLPIGLAIDASNNLYVAEQNGYRIRKITPTGEVSTFIGNGVSAWTDGIGTNAQVKFPRSIVADNAGNLFITDSGIIRKIVIATAQISTFAGGGTGSNYDGTGTNAKFYGLEQICIDKQNNLYAADRRAVRKITPAGVVSTIAGNLGDTGFRNGKERALFMELMGIAIDEAGYLYTAEFLHGSVRRVAPDGTVSNVAGLPALPADSQMTSIATEAGDTDGTASIARFRSPAYIHCDKDNILYITESGGHRIRKIQ